MKQSIPLIVGFVFSTGVLLAQPDSTCPGLKPALQAWAKKDTTTTIDHIGKFFRSNPENSFSQPICLRLGQFYLAKGEIDSAISILEEGLELPRPRWICYSIYDKTLTNIDYNATKANICLLLAEIARRQSDYPGELYHLLMADTKYVAYAHCLNGMEDFRASITPQIADAYLRIGDSAKAIARLFRYVLYRNDVLEKLKPILLKKYSHEQIKREFKKSVARIRRVDELIDNEKYSFTVFSVFGYTMFRESYSDLKSVRKYINEYPRLDWFRRRQ